MANKGRLLCLHSLSTLRSPRSLPISLSSACTLLSLLASSPSVSADISAASFCVRSGALALQFCCLCCLHALCTAWCNPPPLAPNLTILCCHSPRSLGVAWTITVNALEAYQCFFSTVTYALWLEWHLPISKRITVRRSHTRRLQVWTPFAPSNDCSCCARTVRCALGRL